MAAPVITSLDPVEGAIGEQVTIEGTGFGINRVSSSVSFNGVAATQYDSWSDTGIVCRVPEGISGVAEITLTTPTGPSNPTYFLVWPTITGIDPNSGPMGTKVNIEGSAFGSTRVSSYVSFSGAPVVIYDSWSDTNIVCYVPGGITGEVEVTVTTPGGTSGGMPFSTTAPAPTWYLAEGSTAGGMETFVLVQNPGEEAAEVTLSFMTGEGPRTGPSATLPAGTRKTFKLNDYVTSWDVSTRVDSDKPVVAERAMYGDAHAWAHDSIGTTAFIP
jgi:hypothetical protein